MEGEIRKTCNVIVNNDTTMGADCLTWVNKNSRVKIYNKCIRQEVTSPGADKKLGKHII